MVLEAIEAELDALANKALKSLDKNVIDL